MQHQKLFKNYNIEYKEKKMAHRVAIRIKDSDSKFSGDRRQCWQEYKDSFDNMAEGYDLWKDQRSQFLHNLLSKDSPQLYYENVEPFSLTYKETSHFLEKENNSIVR